MKLFADYVHGRAEMFRFLNATGSVAFVGRKTTHLWKTCGETSVFIIISHPSIMIFPSFCKFQMPVKTNGISSLSPVLMFSVVLFIYLSDKNDSLYSLNFITAV